MDTSSQHYLPGVSCLCRLVLQQHLQRHHRWYELIPLAHTSLHIFDSSRSLQHTECACLAYVSQGWERFSCDAAKESCIAVQPVCLYPVASCSCMPAKLFQLLCALSICLPGQKHSQCMA